MKDISTPSRTFLSSDRQYIPYTPGRYDEHYEENEPAFTLSAETPNHRTCNRAPAYKHHYMAQLPAHLELAGTQKKRRVQSTQRRAVVRRLKSMGGGILIKSAAGSTIFLREHDTTGKLSTWERVPAANFKIPFSPRPRNGGISKGWNTDGLLYVILDNGGARSAI